MNDSDVEERIKGLREKVSKLEELLKNIELKHIIKKRVKTVKKKQT